MDYIVVFLASALAGIGTGLVGLSAATAMVPLLIVLCPVFRGEHGAFMATAIALASDVPGSAVTAAVYARHKHLDLKHGWLLMACIIGMCAAGSVAAYFTHQQVLGGFSLFLCVAIGIRFLLSPDSKERPVKGGEVKLSGKGIAVSLFFGLTIGFGTGFFGSGGGMMMLIVFTAMLGYDRLTAVGTSTFIMTFTALIASVSHILMEPAIVLECLELLLLAMATATVFSLLSARFANRVKGKAVGYVTGSILLILGLVLVFLNYREQLDPVYATDFFHLLGLYVGYIVIAATTLLVIRSTTKVPDYVFRKLLHIVAFTAILPLLLGTEHWFVAVAVQLVFLLLVILALHIFEPFPFYSRLFVEKAKHEVLTSFILLFGMMTVMIAVFWGVWGEEHKYIAAVSILAWGPGDAAAAIVGHLRGRHKLSGPHIEGVKSREGTIAMGVTSFVCTFISLLLLTDVGVVYALVVSLVTAPVSALVELYTKHGLDTITCPLAASVVLSLGALL